MKKKMKVKSFFFVSLFFKRVFKKEVSFLKSGDLSSSDQLSCKAGSGL